MPCNTFADSMFRYWPAKLIWCYCRVLHPIFHPWSTQVAIMCEYCTLTMSSTPTLYKQVTTVQVPTLIFTSTISSWTLSRLADSQYDFCSVEWNSISTACLCIPYRYGTRYSHCKMKGGTQYTVILLHEMDKGESGQDKLSRYYPVHVCLSVLSDL